MRHRRLADAASLAGVVVRVDEGRCWSDLERRSVMRRDDIVAGLAFALFVVEMLIVMAF